MALLAHLSDLHIRFSTRHQEYREVFERLYTDLKKQKPYRIMVTGDLSHQKVNMSPTSIDLLMEFIVNLAKIAPLDIILGNHDVNLQQIQQGDSITPLFNIANRASELYSETPAQKMFLVNNKNKKDIDLSQKAVYLYSESGFYDVEDSLTYGIYSCIDGKILELTKKDPNRKYVAVYHGGLYGARNDNGYILQGDNLIKPTVFNNFDCVMLGDLHEYQSFRDDESMAYAGSVLQNNYGESIKKGYLLWDLDTCTHKRRFILNDYGFAKITIARGESFEERIESIQFSNDKKKTKIFVVWEDYEENYSVEKERQITRLIKDRHGCDVVKVNFEAIEKTKQDDNSVEDSKNEETFLEILKKHIKENHEDCDDELLEEILEFAKYVDKELEIQELESKLSSWDIESIEISNLFSFSEKPIKINFEELKGLIGVFGKNYSGKSNFVKAIVWGLYQTIVDSTDAKKLVNIYTSSNKAYVKVYLNVNGEKYYIFRQVTTKTSRKGESSNTYDIQYKKLVIDEKGNENWVSEISDKKATERVEVKKLVTDVIGTYEDFTKGSLKTQGGKDDYLSQKQQPKNDLINRYIGLEHYRDRYDFGNEFFKDVKKKQKELGNISELEVKVVESGAKIETLNTQIQEIEKKKGEEEINKETVENNVLLETRNLKPVPKIEKSKGELDNEQAIVSETNKYTLSKDSLMVEIGEMDQWLSVNFKKEIPFEEGVTYDGLSTEYTKEQKLFAQEKANYQSTSDWLAANTLVQENDITGFDVTIQNLKVEISHLNNDVKIWRGEKCPTCGTITKQADPFKEQECLRLIDEKNNSVLFYKNEIQKNTDAKAHNNTVNTNTLALQNLKTTLTARKERIDALYNKMQLVKQSEGIITHNAEIEAKYNRNNQCKKTLDETVKYIEFLNANLLKVQLIKEANTFNESINTKIIDLQDQVKSYKLTLYNLNQELTTKTGDLRIEKNNLENFKQKFNEVKEAERTYKKYSIYLQAVDRDGLPSFIIRRKLPIINGKINNILSSIVDFKLELSISSSGDISEYFYFSEDKSDMLSLDCSGSGSQKFISSIVIQDALHFISKLGKPSIKIIDEGFGSLDDDLTSGIVNVLNYLRNRYKHVLVITHRNEIKDFMEHVIEIYKVQDNIPQEVLDKNQYAGITQINLI